MSAETPDTDFADPLAPPPGAFVDGVWQGPHAWRTRHGPAIVHWYLGAPTCIENALLPDGERADLDSNLPESPSFRLKVGDAYIHGGATITIDDVMFAPFDDLPEDALGDDLVRLLEALRADLQFMRDMDKPVIAVALYNAIENKTLTGADQSFALGQRSAARLVAALRANGETYLDYAWGRSPVRPSEADSERVRAHLARMGWAVSSAPD